MVTGIDLVRSQIQVAQGLRLHGTGDESAAAGPDPALRLRAAVPHHHRGPAEQLRPGLRQDPHLPLARGLRHPPRRRLGLQRRGDHPLLRFAAGEDHGMGPRVPRTPASAWTARCASSACAASRPTSRSWRTWSIIRSFQSGQVTTSWLAETPALFQFVQRTRPRHQAAHLSGRRDRQRQSGGGRQAVAGRASAPAPVPPHDPAAPPQGHAPAAATNWARKNSPPGRASRSGCCSPTPLSATPTNRCWPRASAPTTCWPSPTSWRTACTISTQPRNVGRRDVRRHHALPA